jgi:putative ABC transport system permease protein
VPPTPNTPVTLRALSRRPAWAAAVVLVLALGSGVAGAVGGAAWSTLVRPLPYAADDRLVAVFTVERDGTEARNPSTPADYFDWRRRCTSLRETTAARPRTFTWTGRGAAREVPALAATPELFRLLGVEAALGRTFAPADAAGAKKVVLGAAFWRRELGADPAVVGSTLRLDGEPHEVLGVMPDGFLFPPFWATDAEVWVPLTFTPAEAADRDAAYLRVFARLAPGATLEQARAEVAAIATQERSAAGETGATGTNVELLREPTVAAARPVLGVLLGGAGLLLLVTTASAANLLVARALERRPEAALRAALGATGGRLLREGFAEGAVLAGAGGVLGLLLSRWLTGVFSHGFPGFLPPVVRLDLDLVAAALPLLAAGLATLVAALAALRAPGGGWRQGTSQRSVTSGGAGRRVLVGVQMALAVVLLSGAVATALTLWELSHLDVGFADRGVLALDLSLAGAAAGEDAGSQERFLERLVAEVATLPGVERVGVVDHLPLRGDFWRFPLAVQGGAAGAAVAGEDPTASVRVASGGYFAALGVPLRAGRSFGEGDRADGEPVAVVNAALARRYWGDATALDRRIRLGGEDEPWRRVVGVVADAVQTGLAEPVVPEVYVPWSQNPTAWYQRATLVVRHRAGEAPLAAVLGRVASLDPDVAAARPQDIAAVLRQGVAPQRLQLLLTAVFAGAALLLAGAGLHAMVRLFVSARTTELGVRQALGADRRRLLLLVAAEGARVALPALAAGAAVALMALRWLGATVGAAGGAPVAVLAVALSVGLLAIVMVGHQARRAAAVEPMAALRGGAAR